MDSVVERWRQKGRVFFYWEPDKRHGDGWHLAAHVAGCDDLQEVISLVSAARYPSRVPIRVSAPEGTRPKNQRQRLVLSYNRDWEADHWLLNDNGKSLTWEMGRDRWSELSNAVSDMRRGEGDYTLGPSSKGDRIWIWWPPAQR